MKTFDRSTLESIYFNAILPSTTYCISLWGSSHLLSELEDSHIRAARLIHNLSPSIPEVLQKANWNSLSYLYKKRLACNAYQAYYEQTPSNITKLFSKHRTNYNLRDNLKFELIHSKSREDQGVREVIPHIGPIPIIIPLKLFLDLPRDPVFPRGFSDSQSYAMNFTHVDS